MASQPLSWPTTGGFPFTNFPFSDWPGHGGSSTSAPTPASTSSSSSPTQTPSPIPLRANITIDSPSPMLQYTPANLWQPIMSSNDASYASYSDGTAAMTGSSGIGGKITFNFHGTGIWLYGAKRPNHGFYNVTLDSNPAQAFLGYQADAAFQQLLYGATDLSSTQHTITIVNAGPLNSGNSNLTYFDLDWLTFEQDFSAPASSPSSKRANVAAAVSQFVNVTTYGSDSGPHYAPSSDQWPQTSYTSADGSSLISRTTNTANATLSLNFSIPSSAGGGAVGLFGSMDQTHGGYTADFWRMTPDKSELAANLGYSAAYAGNVLHEQLLWYRDGLEPGMSYGLSVRNSPNASYFGLDYVKTWSVGAPTSLGTSSSSKSSSSSSAGPIAGGVVGGVIVVLLLILAAFFLCRRRRARRRTLATPAPLATHDEEKAPDVTDMAGVIDIRDEPAGTGPLSRMREEASSTNVLDLFHLDTPGPVMAHAYPSSEHPYLVPLPAFPPSLAGSDGGRSLRDGEQGVSGEGSQSSNSGTGLLPVRRRELRTTTPDEGRVAQTGTTESPPSDRSRTSPDAESTAAVRGLTRDERVKALYEPTTAANSSVNLPNSNAPPSTIASNDESPTPFGHRQGTPAAIRVIPPVPDPSSTPAPSTGTNTSTPVLGLPYDPDALRHPLHTLHSQASLVTVRRSRDFGPLVSSTPTAEEMVLPPEYEDARQPWESRRE